MKSIILPVSVVAVVGLGLYVVFGTTNQETAERSNLQVQETDIEARDEDASVSATDAATEEMEYEDGEYSSRSSYRVPSGAEEWVDVKLSISSDVVNNLEINYSGIEGPSQVRQQSFDSEIYAQVVGESIDELSLARIGGSSLTTSAFNQALGQIKEEARI